MERNNGAQFKSYVSFGTPVISITDENYFILDIPITNLIQNSIFVFHFYLIRCLFLFVLTEKVYF